MHRTGVASHLELLRATRLLQRWRRIASCKALLSFRMLASNFAVRRRTRVSIYLDVCIAACRAFEDLPRDLRPASRAASIGQAPRMGVGALRRDEAAEALAAGRSCAAFRVQ